MNPRLLNLSPMDVPHVPLRTRYVKTKEYQESLKEYNKRQQSDNSVRRASQRKAARLGLLEAAKKHYRALGWDVDRKEGEIQIHHLKMTTNPEDWVLVPRCLHVYAFHNRRCRNSHPANRSAPVVSTTVLRGKPLKRRS